ncbi:MAG: S8 family serine peptidase [Chloroflexi bacterium]|nr:S8 family serine peptidase [Chloroflexota bacterium]
MVKHAARTLLLAIFGWLLLILFPTSLFTAPPDVDGFDRSSLRKIEPQVLKELLAAKDGRARFIVQFEGSPDLSAARQQNDKAARRRAVVEALRSTAERIQRPALAKLEQGRQRGDVEEYQSLWLINGAAVRGNRESLFSMAARPDVVAIRADRVRHLDLPATSGPENGGSPAAGVEQLQSVEWNLHKIRADLVWASLNITGTGAVVASVDTGVDWQHPALIEKYRGNSGRGIITHEGNWRDFTTDASQYPFDPYGHGTHVTGIMVGSDDNNEIGVAPGAKWIAAKVFYRNPQTNVWEAQDSWIHSAFQWILQPEGNPDLAPDIVNASWGSTDGTDQTFQPDVEALLAAGIIPVFAAGNSGSGAGTVNSPGSLDVAFAVGATDSADVVASFSSRGPSPTGRTKPEVSAPGVSIRSSYPGSYAYMSGTSMATPHVSGILALLEQAKPNLLPVEALSLITSTAQPWGASQPNNDYGWGRVDAYGAVALAMQAGLLRGTVSGSGGSLVAGATITVTNQNTGAQVLARAGQDGFYSLALSAGFYDVRAGAFGYAESATMRVAVDAGTTVTEDFSLAALPAGVIAGLVVEDGSGRPLAATVSLVGTPVSVQTQASTGAFTITAPVGAYDVRAASDRHRLSTQAVVVGISSTTYLTFALPSAPSILVVDSGAWYADSQVGYFTSALDQLEYLYAVHTITDTRIIPTLANLSPYDMVIWSSPLDSPGYIGADGVLALYLDQGGKLLLTGQDVGYYDGGGTSLPIDAPYFRTHLRASLVSDDAGISNLVGVTGSAFSGITLTLNTADSAQNQRYPDIVAPDGVRSGPVVDYERDGVGGIEADVCLPYRVIYLGFGLEGAGPAANRVAWLSRSIDWLVAQAPAREVRVLPAAQRQIQAPGMVATTTMTIWNTGALTDAYAIAPSGGGWAGTLWDESFSSPLTSTGQLAACQAINVGVRTEVPTDVGKNVSNSTTVSLTSLGDPTLQQTATATVKTPAYVLLVDDDRWYDVESRYKNALFDSGYPYDVFDTQGRAGPGISTLGLYSITIWFTGYDWYQPLTAQDEASLAAYLDRGGQLFLSSQDYLYTRRLDDFGANYLGIFSYVDDITAVQVSGVPGDIVGSGLGPYTLSLPFAGFQEWSDEIAPRPHAAASFLNIHGVPTGLTNLDGAGRGRTVFFSFPFEGLAPDSGRLVMDRIVGRALSTDFKGGRSRVWAGDEQRYEVSIFNPGSVTANWTITNPLPTFTAFVPGSSEGGATFDEGANRVLWSGSLAPGEAKQFAYMVRVLPGASGAIGNTAVFDRAGDGVFTRTVTTSVRFAVYLPLIQNGYAGGW